jgi:hypothetical protein
MIAIPVPRPKASLPASSTMKFRLLLITRGKGWAGIESDRREQRPHFLVEVLLDPGLLGGVAVGAAQQVDAVVGQARQDFVVQQRVLARDDLAALLAGGIQVDAGKVVGAALVPVLGQQAGDPHLEEFVQVAADDAQEAQALQQGHGRIFGLRQHAAVELQQRYFPVQEEEQGRGRAAGSGPGQRQVRFQLHIHSARLFHS